MFTISLSFLAIALFCFTQSCGVTAIPAPYSNEAAHDILARATPAPPYFAAYSDKYVSSTLPAPSAIAGFNVFILSFLLIEGPWDNAEVWTSLTASQRATIKSQYAAAGIKLMVSAFGSSDVPTTSGADPVTLANSMASFVIQYDLDGIDVDYEDFTAMNTGNGTAENWLITFTQQLRTQLPQGQYLLTHAPVAPWFIPGKYAGGGYLKVHQTVGNLIDWYNIQFYNQGATEYTTCNTLLYTPSLATNAGSAVFEIAANGVPLSKIVIGKPANTADASNGYVDPTTLATCVSQAMGQGWNAGVMVWEYPDAGTSWITTVRSQSWPV